MSGIPALWRGVFSLTRERTKNSKTRCALWRSYFPRVRIFLPALAIALFFAAVPCRGWEWLNPKPAGTELRGAHFFDSTIGFVVGNNGLIIKTGDAFSTWTVENSGVSKNLYAIFFTDGANGCAVGEGGTIIRTSDGGTTWTAKNSGTQYTLNSVHFTDILNGYAVGDTGIILKTNDGGMGWSRLSSPTLVNIKAVYFVDSTTGWIAGDSGKIYKTVNGGTAWTAENSTVTASLRVLHFETPLIGYAAGTSGKIVKTINGGESWIAQSSGVTSDLYSISFTNETTGGAAGANGVILRTTTGGDIWNAQTSNTTDNLNFITFTNVSAGFTVGSNGRILKTSNGGTAWTLRTTYATDEYLNGTYFLNTMLGWAVGANGEIMRTATGGESWEMQTSGVTDDLNAVYFIDALTGWAAGAGGVILKTANGGMNWSQLDSGNANDLRSIYFTDALTGYAVGYQGAIVKTANGGDSWTTQSAGISNILYSVHCVNASTCVAVGTLGKIIKTTNGGAVWLAQTANTTNSFYSVYMANQSVGYASGYRGTVVRTVDGGATWEMQGTGTLNDLYSIHFYDSTTGYAVGGSGTILKTTAGGLPWAAENSWTSANLRSIDYGDYRTTFAVGDYGVIIANSGPADTAAPTVIDNQSGDDTWRSLNTGVYNVDFLDSGGSHLSKFQVLVCSENISCGDIIGWYDIATEIKSDSYTADWALPAAVWDALPGGESYFSVQVTDYAGHTTSAGPLFYVKKDTTAPSAPVTVNDGPGADSAFATEPATLSANWSGASDPDSGIARYWYGIGTSAGATDVVSWTDSGAGESVTRSGLSLADGQAYYFTVKAENGGGFLSGAANSNGQIYDGSPPSSPAPVNDGPGPDIDFSTDTTKLSANWSASADPHTGLSRYWYAAGTSPGASDFIEWTDNGISTTVAKTGLSLIEGQKYYISVMAENGAGGLTAAVSSDGVVADTSAPEAPAAVNDGEAADSEFASSTAWLAANWTPSVDLQSGIGRYWYAIGTAPGAADITPWTDAGAPAGVVKSGLSLTDGQTYYFSVKAENNVGMLSAAANSNGQTIDATPPEPVAEVNDGIGLDVEFSTAAAQLTANWTGSSDPQSGVAGYWYSIGTATGAADIAGWTNNGSGTSVTRSGLSLTNGGRYYFNIKVENGGGGLSAPVSSNGQTVDATPPEAVAAVNDGAGADIAFSTAAAQLSANWAAATDAESDIARYWYAIGTAAGGSDTVSWTDNGLSAAATRAGLELVEGRKYYFSVKAENRAGLVAVAASSNGQTVDTTAPSIVAVLYDGLGSDIEYSASATELSANWSAAGDPQSGIARYWYSIGTATGATNIAEWTQNGANTSITRTGLSLVNGTKYYFNVRAENGAGLLGVVKSSNGVTVDAAPPASVTGMAAISGNQQIALTWTNPTDPDFSGVRLVRKAVGFPADKDDGLIRFEGAGNTFTDSGLENNTTYYYAAFAYDRASLYSAAGEGARVSATPFALAPAAAEGWNLIGVSGLNAEINAMSVFGSHEYEIVGFNGQFNNLTAAGTVALDMAKGYWIYSDFNAGQIQTNASAYSGNEYVATLTAGWNLFSIPFGTPVKWGAPKATLTCGGTAAPLKPVYYYRNGAGYVKIDPDSGASAIPWTGYWINTGTEQCALSLTK
ncbi:MAG: YCF48-related protein [bacterium]